LREGARGCHRRDAGAAGPYPLPGRVFLGFGAMTNSSVELEEAACMLVTGSNTSGTHPVIPCHQSPDLNPKTSPRWLPGDLSNEKILIIC
jgi:hypothetical protein